MTVKASDSKEREQLTFTGLSKKYPSLPLALEGIGLYHLQEYCCRPKGIHAWQWIQGVEGNGELLLEGRTYSVDAGSGILLPAGCRHDYYGTPEPWITSFLCVNGALLTPATELLELTRPGVYHISDPGHILELEEKIFSLCQKNSIQHAFEISKLLYALLADLALDIKIARSGRQLTQDTKIQKAITYMHDNFHQPIGLSDIAAHLHLTKEYLCQVFKRTTNSTVLEYLTQVRLAEAKTMLLKYPEMTVEEVSRLCGFDSPSYFCSVFKKHERMTPRQFCQSRK